MGKSRQIADDVPSGTNPEELALAELPRAFADRDEAIALAARAGFPRARLPPFNTSAEVFWDKVVSATQRGAFVGGVRALLDTAARAMPGNEMFGVFATNRTACNPESPPGSVSARLDEAYREREDLTVAGEDTTEIDTEILELRRELRRGPTLKPGEFLSDGRFRLIEVVGRGGFASVWKAYDRTRPGLVAIKVLHGQYAEDKSRRERLFRGARQMAKLSHPNIVQVLVPEGEDQGFYYYVMEYVGGGNLHEAIISRSFDLGQSLDILEAVASALSMVHRGGLVHRDIKPRNILLRLNGTPLLTDFDLVYAQDTTGLTRGGGMGTALYAAPEQKQDASSIDHRADVFSFGMTLLFCICRGEMPLEDIWRRFDTFLDDISCSSEFRSILGRALAFDPRSRFEDMATLRLELLQAHIGLKQSELLRVKSELREALDNSGEAERGREPKRWLSSESNDSASAKPLQSSARAKENTNTRSAPSPTRSSGDSVRLPVDLVRHKEEVPTRLEVPNSRVRKSFVYFFVALAMLMPLALVFGLNELLKTESSDDLSAEDMSAPDSVDEDQHERIAKIIQDANVVTNRVRRGESIRVLCVVDLAAYEELADHPDSDIRKAYADLINACFVDAPKRAISELRAKMISGTLGFHSWEIDVLPLEAMLDDKRLPPKGEPANVAAAGRRLIEVEIPVYHLNRKIGEAKTMKRAKGRVNSRSCIEAKNIVDKSGPALQSDLEGQGHAALEAFRNTCGKP